MHLERPASRRTALAGWLCVTRVLKPLHVGTSAEALTFYSSESR